MQETFFLLKATQKEFNLGQRPCKCLTRFYASFLNYSSCICMCQVSLASLCLHIEAGLSQEPRAHRFIESSTRLQVSVLPGKCCKSRQHHAWLLWVLGSQALLLVFVGKPRSHRPVSSAPVFTFVEGKASYSHHYFQNIQIPGNKTPSARHYSKEYVYHKFFTENQKLMQL